MNYIYYIHEPIYFNWSIIYFAIIICLAICKRTMDVEAAEAQQLGDRPGEPRWDRHRLSFGRGDVMTWST